MTGSTDAWLDLYKAKLAALYHGSPIDLPVRIEIGAVEDLPGGNIDFGIIKADGAWTIPSQFEVVVAPILAREAYLAGFSQEAQASKSIQHACNWFAYKDIDDAGVKHAFLKHWMAASIYHNPKDIYALPPVIMQEFNKVADVTTMELHDLLLRFTVENERLLKHQLRIDVAETWGLARSIEFLPAPQPATMAVLHGCGAIFLATGELPKKADVLAYLAEHALFGPIAATRINKDFARASLLFYCQYQLDASYINKKYVHVVFVPARRFVQLDWNAIFSIPGVFIRLNWCQGDLLGESRGAARTGIGYFLLPSSAVVPFIDFVHALHRTGMLEAHAILVGADMVPTANYNTYIPSVVKPRFVIDPIRDEPALFFTREIELARTPAEASACLASIVQNGLGKMRAFIDKLNSFFSIKEGRHDSWYQTLAEVAGIHERTAARWLELVTRTRALGVPEPRTTYYFHPRIPVATRLMLLTRATMGAGERSAMARLFPATASVKARRVDGDDAILWHVLVPPGQAEAAIDLLASKEPGARVAMHVASVQDTFGTLHSVLHWFDGEGYDQLVPFIEACTAAVPGLAGGVMTVPQFRHACHDPAQAALDAFTNLK